ncbi:MAG: hypothetical protein AAFN13_05785 [Bacteroidota bacterium]
MTNAPCIVIVGSSADALASAVAASLRRRGADVLCADPFDLTGLRVSLYEERFTVEDRRVGAIVFRAPPDMSFSRSFRAEDRSFCDAETRALWLAASHLPSVLAVNRYGAGAWFGGTGWTRWRGLFLEAGLPLAPFAFGDVSDNEEHYHWHPYAAGQAHVAPGRATRRTLGAALTPSEQAQVSLVVRGEVVEGEALPAVSEAAVLLQDIGIHVASIATDGKGRVLRVDALPVVERRASVQRSAHLISHLCHAHLRRW